MIALDTNIIARFLLNDNLAQPLSARKFIMKATKKEAVYLSAFVVVELVWLLQKAGWKREKIVDSITDFIQTKNVLTGDMLCIEKALCAYKEGKADFPDYLILADGARHGARELATFDTVFAKEQVNCHSPEHWL